MALLILDPKSLELKILVGVLEDYAPDKEIKDINNGVVKLKARTSEFMEELTGLQDMKECMEFFKTNKDKNDEFVSFIKGEFNDGLVKFNKRIESKNIKICPNYKDSKE